MLMGEYAHGKLSHGDQICWAWWTSGNYGDTMFTTLYPLNPFNKVGDLGTGDGHQLRPVYLGRARASIPAAPTSPSATAR